MSIRVTDKDTNIISTIDNVTNSQVPSLLLEQISHLKQNGYTNFKFFKAQIGIEGTNPRINTSETCYLLSYNEAFSADALITGCNFSQTLTEYAVKVLLKVSHACAILESKGLILDEINLDEWNICFK
jgi:hypothetical protein